MLIWVFRILKRYLEVLGGLRISPKTHIAAHTHHAGHAHHHRMLILVFEHFSAYFFAFLRIPFKYTQLFQIFFV